MNRVNELELALRRLPGVRSAGFSERDDFLFVQVHTEPAGGDPGVALQVTRLASRYSEQPVAVEVVRWRDSGTEGRGVAADATVDLTAAEEAEAEALDPDSLHTNGNGAGGVDASRETRVRLLAVLSFPDAGEIEVHLALGGQRTIGRAPSERELVAAAEATVDALRGLLPELDFAPVWAREAETTDDAGHVVAVGLSDGRAPRHGIAAGDTDMEAAARATLDALNRSVALQLAPST